MDHTANMNNTLNFETSELVHDFRNILNVIQGYSKLALMELPQQSTVSEMMVQIQSASQQGLALCLQMLGDARQQFREDERGDLTAIIHNMESQLKISLRELGTIEFHLAADLPSVKVPPVDVRRILANLVTNASQALGEHPGTVDVRTGTMNLGVEGLQGKDLVGTLTEGDYAFLEVSDTGCGMEDVTLQRVFDPFFTTRLAGQGLGMAAVLRIVTENGGALRIDSHVGVGTTVRALFPLGKCGSPRTSRDPKLIKSQPTTRVAYAIAPRPGRAATALVES